MIRSDNWKSQVWPSESAPLASCSSRSACWMLLVLYHKLKFYHRTFITGLNISDLIQRIWRCGRVPDRSCSILIPQGSPVRFVTSLFAINFEQSARRWKWPLPTGCVGGLSPFTSGWVLLHHCDILVLFCWLCSVQKHCLRKKKREEETEIKKNKKIKNKLN